MNRALHLVTAATLAVLFILAAPAAARSTAENMAAMPLADLPPEGRSVYALIQKGGPFKYDRDGVVFGNREQLLPAKPRGYYHEYTVPTQGSKTRGARRIVCGGPQKAPEACYYTHDHYQSFRRIQP